MSVPRHRDASQTEIGQNEGSALEGTFTKPENPWAEFFGPANLNLNLSPYDKQRLDCLDLPDAYRGRNYFIQELLEGLLLNNMEWYTTAALRVQFENNINLAWNETSFNRSVLDEVPERGVPRLITASNRSFTEKQVRRGIMMMLEHGFLNTEAGRRHYRQQLVNISNSIKVTNAYDVLTALLSARRYDIQWELNHGIRYDDRAFLRRKKNAWAVLQKSEHGFSIMVEEAKRRMRNLCGVDPSMLILPSKATMYLSMLPTVNQDYKIIGPRGQEMMIKGPDAITEYRGLKVYETSSFDLYDDQLPVDLLANDRQIGSYWVISADDPRQEDPNGNDFGIRIYDEEEDRWDLITLRDAVAEANAFPGGRPAPRATNSQFTVRPIDAVDDESQQVDFTQAHIDDGENWALFKDNKHEGTVAENVAMFGDEIITAAQAATEDSAREVRKNSANGAPRMLIIRPYQTYEMCDAIMLAEGAGKFFIGSNSFVLSDDGVSKITYGTYHYYSKAVVTNPKKVMIIENIMSQGYVGGGGTKWIRHFGTDNDGEYKGDLIAIPLNPGRDLPNPIILNEDFARTYVVGGAQTLRNLGLSIGDRHADDNGTYAYNRPNARRNNVLWAGKCLNYAGDRVLDRETGPWCHTYQGCDIVRSGNAKYCDDRNGRIDF